LNFGIKKKLPVEEHKTEWITQITVEVFAVFAKAPAAWLCGRRHRQKADDRGYERRRV
jgi:hypothetical protein